MGIDTQGAQALTDANGMTEEEFLASYDITRYPQPSVTVDNVIFTVEDNDLRILLIRRGGHPFLGCWALPGGFMSIDEDTDEAVRREVQEETGILIDGRIGFFEQLRTFSAPQRDPRGRILSVAHMTLIPAGKISDMHAGDDAMDAAWFSIRLIDGDGTCAMLTQVLDEDAEGTPVILFVGDGHALDGLSGGNEDVGSLAFDHGEILSYAISRLVAKIAYSCIAFALLNDPSCFTLTELRHVYEATTGRRYDMGNFQRMFKKVFVAAGLASVTGSVATSGRPATTYVFTGDRYDLIVR